MPRFELKTSEFVDKHFTFEPPNRHFLPSFMCINFARIDCFFKTIEFSSILIQLNNLTNSVGSVQFPPLYGRLNHGLIPFGFHHSLNLLNLLNLLDLLRLLRLLKLFKFFKLLNYKSPHPKPQLWLHE